MNRRISLVFLVLILTVIAGSVAVTGSAQDNPGNMIDLDTRMPLS